MAFIGAGAEAHRRQAQRDRNPNPHLTFYHPLFDDNQEYTDEFIPTALL